MMEVLKYSQIAVASTVSLYWFCVAVMVIRNRKKNRVGSVPKTGLERGMWVLWCPTIIAWIALTWNSDNVIHGAIQSQVGLSIWMAMIIVSAIAAVVAFALTTRCWMAMGKDWSMAVEPGKETRLITDGPFSSVRHPIYALSLLLMISSLLVVTNFPMIIAAAIHCGLLVLKAWNEEHYLTKLHGQEYLDYLNRTNRFVPLRAFFG